jgi:hypothetical protein
MRLVLEIGGAAAGIAALLRGVRVATTRPRPRDLGGMLLAALGMALALGMLSAASAALGR